MDWWSILAILLVAVAVYVYLTWNYDFFTSRGIPGPTPRVLIGTFDRKMMDKGLHALLLDNFKKYGRIIGSFDGRKPSYMIADHDILKQILVKQFPTFTSRRPFYLVGQLGKSLFHNPNGKDWKRLRSLLTPAFTGSKMRQMERAVLKCADNLVRNLEQTAGKPCDIKAYTGGFTMDVIASTTFSINIDSQNNKDDPFVKNAGLLLNVDIKGWMMYVALMLQDLLPLMDYLGLTYLPKGFFEFFRNVVNTVKKQRKVDGKKNVDLLELMLTAQDQMDDADVKRDLQLAGIADVKPTRGLSEDELLSNSMLVLSAGYDTTANTLAFLMYNLATHQDIQEKVYQEIIRVMQDHEVPGYDVANKLPYLDMCISETLRLYPIIPIVTRCPCKDTEINGVFFPKGILVTIPIYVLHMDPEVWQEPNKFDPERFSNEAKATRHPMSYMPFGVGPRQCLGMRLAHMEMKMVIVNMIQKFSFHTTEETQIPLKLKVAVFTEPEKAIILKANLR